MNVFTTERLAVRHFTKKDGASVYRYLSKPEVTAFEPYLPLLSMEEGEKEAERRAANDAFLAVSLKDGTVIGNLYAQEQAYQTWEVGYVFDSTYWKQGYASESMHALITYLFQIKEAHRITAMCDPSNEASWRLLEHLQLRREGELKKNVYFFKDQNNQPFWKDTYLYGMLRHEWQQKKEEVTQ